MGCLGTETRSGSRWGAHTVQEQDGADQELVTLRVFRALGNWLMFVLGLGLFPFLWGLPPPQAHVCGQWDEFLFSTWEGLWPLLT